MRKWHARTASGPPHTETHKKAILQKIIFLGPGSLRGRGATQATEFRGRGHEKMACEDRFWTPANKKT